MAEGLITDTGFAERGSKAYRQIILSMFIAGLCTFAQLYFLQPLLPVLSRYFSITPAHSSLVISAATLALAGGLLLGTFMADKIQRKTLMSTAMLISSVLTIISAFVGNFTTLIIISACKGFALSGVAAIAMAYIGEEVAPAVLSRTMSRYIIGTIIGGMTGRVVANLLVAWISWRMVTLVIGVSCLLLSLEFLRRLPASKNFKPRKLTAKQLFGGIGANITDLVLLALCLFAGLAMGSFVSVYNYLGFRLEAAPFSLPHQLIAGIFMMYAVGVGGSFVAAPWAERFGMKTTLSAMALVALTGILLTWPNQIVLIIIGLGLLTFGFFGAHTIASSWAGTRTPENRAIASSMYLLFYYIGSSLLGTFSGVTMHKHGWNGMVILLAITLGLAFILTLLINQTNIKKRANNAGKD